MTTEECLALAVLKGDMTAARALADRLIEQDTANEVRVLPALKVMGKNVKALVYMKEPILSSSEYSDVVGGIRAWLDGRLDVAVTAGIDRIELYEFPDAD